MKKLIIGLAAGAMALGASVVPASAGSLDPGETYDPPSIGTFELPYSSSLDSIWDLIDGRGPLSGAVQTALGIDPQFQTSIAEQLVLLAGMANTLDQCGNGKPTYTLFLPTEMTLAIALTEVLDVTIADLAETPAVVKAILSDHLVAGAVDPYLLTSVKTGIKKLVAISGYVINIRTINTALYSEAQFWTDWYANGFQLQDATVTCNGWVYDMFGLFQAEDYVETFGTNNKPPTGSAVSALPETL